MNIGPNIKRIREARSLSSRDLAFKTNIAENSLSAFEHSKKGVGLSTLLKLADALNCSLDYLCGRTTTSQPISTSTQSEMERVDSDKAQFLSVMSEKPLYSQDEQSTDKAQFLAIMSDLYDKYFKISTPAETRDAETRDADDSVGKDREEALSSLKSNIESGREWKESLWTCVRL